MTEKSFPLLLWISCFNSLKILFLMRNILYKVVETKQSSPCPIIFFYLSKFKNFLIWDFAKKRHDKSPKESPYPFFILFSFISNLHFYFILNRLYFYIAILELCEYQFFNKLFLVYFFICQNIFMEKTYLTVWKCTNFGHYFLRCHLTIPFLVSCYDLDHLNDSLGEFLLWLSG